MVSITNPINKPTTGPKYQPIIIPGSQAKEIVIPATMGTLNKFNNMLKPNKAAKTQIPVTVLKTLTGQNGKKNLSVFNFKLVSLPNKTLFVLFGNVKLSTVGSIN